MNSPLTWRPMTLRDLSALLAIADVVHPAYPEEPTVFAERMALYPDGCLTLERAGALVGYIVSHPWLYGDLPKLNNLLDALPAAPTTYYIHDIALLPEARGSGAAAEIIEGIIGHAGQLALTNVSLTAVNDSVAFWQRHSFRVVHDTNLDAKLRSYDADARFMMRDIA